MQAKLLVFSLLVVAAPRPDLHAQNAAQYSTQFSVLYNALGGDDYTNINAGIGAEAQVRRRFAAWSLGGGLQYTRHNVDAAAAGVAGHVSLGGVFIEPRYVIATNSTKAAPYLSGRLAFLRQSYSTDLFDGSASGVQSNLGGGVLISMSPRVNLDLGATFGVVNFGKFSVDDPNLSVESGSGSGTNVVLRAGVSIGVAR